MGEKDGTLRLKKKSPEYQLLHFCKALKRCSFVFRIFFNFLHGGCVCLSQLGDKLRDDVLWFLGFLSRRLGKA